MKKQIAILGSTGSIGTQALQVIEEHSDLYEVYCLTANNRVELLAQQARKFKPAAVVIANEARYDELKALREEVEELSREDQMSEAAILALRLNRGLTSKEFYDEFGKMPDEVFKDAIEKHIREGLLEISPEGDLKLTENGRDLANYVMADFL